MLEFTDKEPPINRNPSPIHVFANVGPPYMATLPLLGFTIGLPMWLFSTSLIPNKKTIPPQPSFSPQPSSSSQHHKPLIDPIPSSPNMSYAPSSSSLGKSHNDSNMLTNTKKKWKKKKQDKKGVNQPTMAADNGYVE